MKKITTRMEKVEKTTTICDICNEEIDAAPHTCKICKRDLCYKDCCHYGGDVLPIFNYHICAECDAKLEPWREKLREIKSKYEHEQKAIFKDFRAEFGLEDD